MINPILRSTSFVHYILKDKIKKGDTVVDATMGNGNDTIFLARLVGDKGRVFSFDIQEMALRRTLEKIKDCGLGNYNIELIRDSHENMEKYIDQPIDGVMFNLGYLPKGDQSIITRPVSTIKAIKSALKLLKPAGIMSIIIYYGHQGGGDERDQVLNYLGGLSSRDFTVMKSSYINRDKNPPITVFVDKR